MSRSQLRLTCFEEAVRSDAPSGLGSLKQLLHCERSRCRAGTCRAHRTASFGALSGSKAYQPWSGGVVTTPEVSCPASTKQTAGAPPGSPWYAAGRSAAASRVADVLTHRADLMVELRPDAVAA